MANGSVTIPATLVGIVVSGIITGTLMYSRINAVEDNQAKLEQKRIPEARVVSIEKDLERLSEKLQELAEKQRERHQEVLQAIKELKR
jgi:uncharacterized membrane protein (DUF106 family)